ncbi:MAG: hopanoid-associated sugar epimerase [Pseudomonadota bacterium]
MKILITGATGFVGSAVLLKLIEKGHHVRALVRPSSDLSNLEGTGAEVVTGDLNDRNSLGLAVDGCEALFHVAADYRLWVLRPETIYRTNVRGTRDIMRAALGAGVKRIVYTSSVATLGFTRDGSPADEATPVTIDDMIGHYKRSKFLAEAEVSRMVERDGLPAVIVNPSTPIGPRDIKPTPTGRMILEAAAGHMPAYVDTGLNVVHVDDVAAGHLLAFERGKIGERYILGARNVTLKEILTELATITGRPTPRVRLPHNLVLPIAYVTEAWGRLTGKEGLFLTVDGIRMAKKRMFFSVEKARRNLGFVTRPVGEALRDAVDWFKEKGYINRAG